MWVGLEDLAATDFPAPCGAVSWALGVFTAEFGMGSGVLLPAMATRSSEPSVPWWGLCGVDVCGLVRLVWERSLHVCVPGGFRIRSGESSGVPVENRSGAAVWAVSTGSADRGVGWPPG